MKIIHQNGGHWHDPNCRQTNIRTGRCIDLYLKLGTRYKKRLRSWIERLPRPLAQLLAKNKAAKSLVNDSQRRPHISRSKKSGI